MKKILWVITIGALFLLVLDIPLLHAVQLWVFRKFSGPIMIFYAGAVLFGLWFSGYLLEEMRTAEPKTLRWGWALIMIAIVLYCAYAKIFPGPPRVASVPNSGKNAIFAAILELIVAFSGIVASVKEHKARSRARGTRSTHH